VAHGALVEEVVHKKGNVVLSIPKRRQVDGNDIEPVVEVLTEASALDLFFQVFVGGADDTDIGGQGLFPPTFSKVPS